MNTKYSPSTKYSLPTITTSLLAVGLVSGALFVAGCDTQTKQTESSEVSATTKTEVQAEAEAQSEKKDLPMLNIGIDATYAPFEFLDENGKPIGFEVDLMSSIADKAGYNVTYFTKDRQNAEQELTDGTRDIWISAFSKSGSIDKPYLHTQPVAQYTLTVALLDNPKNADINTIEDLKGKKVAVTATSTRTKDIAKNLIGATGEMLEKDTFPLVIKSVATGEADMLIGNNRVLQYTDKQDDNIAFKYVDIQFEPKDLVFLVNPQKPELLEQVNAALTDIKNSGEYTQISQEWFNE